MPWEANKFLWLALCDIHFILVVWNWTYNISAICLYFFGAVVKIVNSC